MSCILNHSGGVEAICSGVMTAIRDSLKLIKTIVMQSLVHDDTSSVGGCVIVHIPVCGQLSRSITANIMTAPTCGQLYSSHVIHSSDDSVVVEDDRGEPERH